MPIATHVVEHVPIKHGVCIRPVPLRRIDPDTGISEIVDVPCGATTDDKCPPCAERQRNRRKAQCRQGWHAEQEPILEPDEPSDRQTELATTRADLERAHANALANGEDTEPIEAAIDQVEQELTASGVRGSVTRDKPKKSRSTKRRQDVPDLPRTKVAPVTIGRTYTGNNGRTFRPSVFLTPTLPSYGPVDADGVPRNMDTYDYRRQARRSVPLSRSLVDPLTAHIASKGPDAVVFTAPGGGVLRNHNFRRRVFLPAAELVGVPGLTPHDLRHTAASLAVQAGANVKAVQRMLGHASAAMTLDVYAGLFGDDLDAVADRLDDAAVRARADSLRTRGNLRPLSGPDERGQNAV